jgi:hypothetical protein
VPAGMTGAVWLDATFGPTGVAGAPAGKLRIHGYN